MRKVKVALHRQPGSATIDPNATEGAVFGVNLRNPDGSLVTAEQLAAAGVSIEGIATTDALPEGARNLYYTDARADARADAKIAAHVALADPHDQYQPNLQFQDEGSNAGAAGQVNTVNFTGAGVTASESGGVLTVDVPGGGGSGSYSQVDLTGSAINSAATTEITLLSDSLAAGTWLVTAYVTISASVAQTPDMILDDSTTPFAAVSATIGAGTELVIAVSGVVVLSATTTVRLRLKPQTASSLTVQYQSNVRALGGATRMISLKIA